MVSKRRPLEPSPRPTSPAAPSQGAGRSVAPPGAVPGADHLGAFARHFFLSLLYPALPALAVKLGWLVFFGSAELCGPGGPALDLLDCAEDHRRGALDGPAHQMPGAVAVMDLGEPVPCQNLRSGSELEFSVPVRLLFGTRLSGRGRRVCALSGRSHRPRRRARAAEVVVPATGAAGARYSAARTRPESAGGAVRRGPASGPGTRGVVFPHTAPRMSSTRVTGSAF
jgi:hypothetical protein